jgi:hypothetical protein
VRTFGSSLGIGEAYLSNEDDKDDEKSEPRSCNTSSSLEWDLVNGMAVVSPRLAETDVGQADGAPGEEGGKTGKSDQPVENSHTSRGHPHVSETTPQKDECDGVEGTTRAVDVVEDLGSITLVGKRSEGTRSTVYTRHTNGNNGDKNDNIHEAVKTNETGVLGSNDERRSVGSITSSTEQTLVVVPDQKTDKGKTEDVEESDTPEDLTNSTGKRLERVLCLSSGKTDQFGSGEGKGGSDEDGAESLEAVVEGTWIVPGTGTPVLGVDTIARASTANKNQSDNHEDDGRGELEARRPEFFFSVSKRSEDVDQNDEYPEDGHKYGWIGAFGAIPIRNG